MDTRATPAPDDDVRSSDAGLRTPSGSYRAGHRLGRYVLEGPLGRGGMGMVYRARHVELDRVVALKVLLPGPELHADEIARFAREARLLAGLRHANIVSLHDFDQAEGVHFYTMDLVDGEDLGERLARGAMPARRAMEVIREAARGVAHAHAHGVVHRDLKPGNILLGRDGRIYVTDFGLAKRTDARKDQLTVSGSMVGTPAYMSPEQAAGELARIDARSDVYGLGAVLYHALAGRVPFDGENLYDILCRTMQEDPPPMPPGVPRDADVICRKCLEKEPSRRYADAGALAADIDRYLAGEAIVARPAGLVERVRRRAVRHRALVVAALLAMAAGAATLAVSGRRYERRLQAVKHAAEAKYAFAMNDLDAAARHAEAAVAADPGHAAGYFWRARLRLHEYVRGRRLPMAILSDGMIEFSPEFPETARQRDVRAGALAELDRMKTLARDGLEGWEEPCALGLVACFRGDPAEAERRLREASEKDVQARYALALSLYRLRRFAEAALLAAPLLKSPLADEARELFVRAKEAEGLTLESRGRDPLAAYRAALDEAPPILQAQVRTTRAEHHRNRGKPEAEAESRAAIDLARTLDHPLRDFVVGRARVGLALWLDDHGRVPDAEAEYTAAAADFERALDRDPALLAARLGRMNALNFRYLLRERLGRRDESRRDAEETLAEARRILEAGPYFDAVMRRHALEWNLETWTPAPFPERMEKFAAHMEKLRAHLEKHEARNPRAWLDLGAEYNNWGNDEHARGRPAQPLFQRALEYVQRALELNPESADALVNLAIVRQNLSLYAADESELVRAVEHAERALALHPGFAMAHRVLADTWSRRLQARESRGEEGSDEERRCLDAFDRAVSANPGLADAYVGRGGFLLGRAIARHAAGAGRDEDFQKALDDLDRALAINAVHFDAPRERGVLWMHWALFDRERGRDPDPKFDRAFADFKTALYWSPEDARGYVERARTWRNRGGDGDFARALADVDRALQLNPESAWAHACRADVLLSMGIAERERGGDPTGLLTDSIESSSRALALNAGLAATYQKRATAFLNLGLYRKDDPERFWSSAAKDFDEAIRRAPRNLDLYASRGDLHFNRAYEARDRRREPGPHLEAAIRDYTVVLKTRPDDEGALDGRGRMYFAQALEAYERQEDPVPALERATADFGRLLKRNPGKVEVWVYRGRAHYLWQRERQRRGLDAREQGRAAVADCSEALKARPKDVGALFWRGCARYYAEEWAAAKEDFEAILTIEDNTRARALLEDCKRRLPP